MVKTYEYEYDTWDASVTLEVDLEKFDKTMALLTLNFFSWNWDREADPIDEVMKKYAMECLRIASHEELNIQGVIIQMNHVEGFGPVDGSIGIKLVEVSGVELDIDKLTLKE